MALQQAMAPAYAAPLALPRPAYERLKLRLLVFAGASSAFVFIEPSPYEFATLLALGLFLITGLSLNPSLIPFGALLVLLNLGYTISASALFHQTAVATWVLTSWYLAITAFFFAALLGTNTEARVNALMRGCMIAGVIAALAGVAGYFRLIPGGADLLLLYGRARGTFKDPNVYGAFLVLPALLALRGVILADLRRATGNLLLLALFAAALLLSFSRGAWGQMAFAGTILLALTFITTRSPHQRMRIVLLTIGGVAMLALFVAALSSVGAVADLLKERLSLSQSYDVGETGRFGRHALGALLALDMPLGLGPLQFARIFPEDPHNSFLNAFVSGGWLSGLCYLTLTLVTLAFGLRAALKPTPWQSTTIVIYAAFAGTAAESAIIDTDHWRHAFLLLGVMWGLIAASGRMASAGTRRMY